MQETLSVHAGPRRPRPRLPFEPLATTSWALMTNTVTTAVLGMVFWVAASRIYAPNQLGEDAALVSAMMLLSTVSQLNLGMAIPRLLPQVKERQWRPVVGAYGVTAAVGAVLTVTFLFVAPRLSESFQFLGRSPALGLGLVAAVVLWNVFALQDAVLTSARWALAVPVENALFGLLKIALMLWLANGLADHGVFVAWLLAMAVLLVPVNGLLFGRVLPVRRQRPADEIVTVLPLRERSRIVRYLAIDYLAALLSQGSTALLPLLVIGVLGRADTAYFYVAFLVATAVGALAQNLSVSLVAEGAHDESQLVGLTRQSIARYFKWVAPSVALMIVAAPVMLAPFGAEYAAKGSTLLRLLLAGTLAQAVVTLYLGVERLRAQVRRVLVVEAATIVLVITGAFLGMRWYGLAGVGLAWLAAQVSMAACVAPRLWRLLSTAGSGSETLVKLKEKAWSGANAHVASVRRDGLASAVDLVDLAAALVTVTLLITVGLGVTGPTRFVLALVFVTFVPGWAVLDHVALAEGVSRMALAVALSLSLTAAAALASLWLHVWHPRALLDVGGALCLLAIVVHVARSDDRRAVQVRFDSASGS